MSSNLGWLFYRDYFRGINYADLESEANEHTIQKKLENLVKASALELEESEILGNTHFKATTSYPGLILGSGNAHELPDIKGQAILGFSFDYTSGLPVIAGSSIKGVLRSAFKHKEYIEELTECKDVEALEAEIFDNGDVFFDATIIARGGSNILGDDYLAPHGEDALKNPIPLRFIKVMPNVTFRFDFELTSGILSKHKKAELFRSILEDLGLGAKTNVGYGKFDNFAKEQTKEEQEAEKLEREEEMFNEAINADSMEALEKFKQSFSSSSKIAQIDEAIANFKANQAKADIKRAFDNLDKSKKNHVDGFVKKYKDNPDAKEFLEQLQNQNSSRSRQNNMGIEALSSVEKANDFKNILHKHQEKSDFSDEDKRLIEENVLRVCKGLNKKKRTKFIKDIKVDKYLSKDFVEKLKESVEKQANE